MNKLISLIPTLMVGTLVVLLALGSAVHAAESTKPAWQIEWENTLEAAKKEGQVMVNISGYAAKVFINWLLSRKGQTLLQKVLAATESPADSMRSDMPKDDVPIDTRRVDGVKYIDTGKPEWQDMKPIHDLINEALQAAGKS